MCPCKKRTEVARERQVICVFSGLQKPVRRSSLVSKRSAYQGFLFLD